MITNSRINGVEVCTLEGFGYITKRQTAKARLIDFGEVCCWIPRNMIFEEYPEDDSITIARWLLEQKGMV